MSLTQVVRFSSTRLKVLGKNRVQEESATTASVQKQNLQPRQAGDFRFLAHYHPQFVFHASSTLGFEYSISAFDQDGKIVTHSNPIQIIIPLKTKR